MSKSNKAKVKITQTNTGRSFFKDAEVAKQILEHPRFKNSYKAETLAQDPPEVAEETKSTTSTKKVSGAAAEKQDDDSTN